MKISDFMKVLVISVFITIVSSSVNASEVLDEEVRKSCSELIYQFDQASINGDVNKLMNLMDESIIVQYNEGPPIIGKTALESFLGFVFSKYKIDVQSSVDSVFFRNDILTALVRSDQKSIVIQNNQEVTFSSSYFYHFRKIGNNYKISQITESGVLELKFPFLPEPSGIHKIGKRNFYFENQNRDEILTENKTDKRKIGFQAWYPAEINNNTQAATYSTTQTNETLRNFYQWPAFFNSFSTEMKTHSHTEADIKKSNKAYPVVFYHHGYSGHSSVHQVLFEELASHGFVVVSVGHAYESSVLFTDTDSLIPFLRDNPVLLSRNEEASDDFHEALKDDVIRADTKKKRLKAYQKLVSESPKHNQSLNEWVKDNLNVLEKLEELNQSGQMFDNSLDLDNVGVIGHSLGGAVAGELVLVDNRFKAGVNLDGFQFGTMINKKLKKPFMFVAADRPFAAGTTISNDVFYFDSQADCYLASIPGYQHSSFSDLVIFEEVWNSGFDLKESHKKATVLTTLVTEFFHKYLKHDNSVSVGRKLVEEKQVKLWSKEK